MKQVNNTIYETYGDRWYTAWDDPVALLRMENKAKIPWVLERSRECLGGVKGMRVLDVGCGGGFLANALAAEGALVTGIDAAKDSLQVAARFDSTGTVRYLEADALALPFPAASFDLVVCMDLLEHVEDPEAVVREIGRVLRPGGLFLFHTFNRNPVSYLVAIKLVEWFVKNTPRHLHVYRLFLKPKEVELFCKRARMEVKGWAGLRPRMRTVSWRSFLSGTVPASLEFKVVSSRLISYLGWAVRPS